MAKRLRCLNVIVRPNGEIVLAATDSYGETRTAVFSGWAAVLATVPVVFLRWSWCVRVERRKRPERW